MFFLLHDTKLLFFLCTPTCIFPSYSVDCGDLTVPSNGAISYTSGTFLGSTATYSCDLGYDLSGGDAVRICESDGEWSGNEPSGCQGKHALTLC